MDIWYLWCWYSILGLHAWLWSFVLWLLVFFMRLTARTRVKMDRLLNCHCHNGPLINHLSRFGKMYKKNSIIPFPSQMYICGQYISNISINRSNNTFHFSSNLGSTCVFIYDVLFDNITPINQSIKIIHRYNSALTFNHVQQSTSNHAAAQ